jgi:hypothetical protein
MASTGNQNTGHSLFRGARFWLSQTVPQRLRFKEEIAVCCHSTYLIAREVDRYRNMEGLWYSWRKMPM